VEEAIKSITKNIERSPDATLPARYGLLIAWSEMEVGKARRYLIDKIVARPSNRKCVSSTF
jgi:hypothetical protein